MKARALFPMVPLVIAIGSLLLASCSSAPPGSGAAPGASTTPSAAATATKPYGSLTIGWSTFSTAEIDPSMGSTVAPYRTLSIAIFDSLVDVGPDAQPRPAIAERWEIAKDGLTQTFWIRKGVKFHDGTDLTGADVKFSIERILAPGATNQYASAWRGLIASVDLKDDYTVVVHLKTPMFDFPDGLGDVSGVSAVVPKKYVEEKGVDYFRRNPVGSGPFKFVSYDINNRLELEAVESHWRTVPQFKNLTVLKVPDEASRLAMLRTGELDIAEVSPDSAATLKGAGLRIVDWDAGSGAVSSLYYDVNNPEKMVFGDVRVRKALSLAVDRKTLADDLLRGYAEPSIPARQVPKYANFFDSNVLKVDPYAPDQAKRLLAEAGYPNGFKMKAWDRGMGINTESMITMALAGYWQKVGVNAEVTPIDWTSGLTPLIRPQMKPAIYDSECVFVTGGAMRFEGFAAGYHSKRAFSQNVKNPKIDELIEKYPMTLDQAEKKRIALEAVQLAGSNYEGSIAYLWIRTIAAIGPKVGTLTPFKGIGYLGPSYATVTHAK